MGWTVARGVRPGDWYICPPGGTRRKGFKKRVGFFDSIPQVKMCLETDERYCNQTKIVSLLKEAKELEALLMKLLNLGEIIPQSMRVSLGTNRGTISEPMRTRFRHSHEIDQSDSSKHWVLFKTTKRKVYITALPFSTTFARIQLNLVTRSKPRGIFVKHFFRGDDCLVQ
jgi:hypothetical protein